MLVNDLLSLIFQQPIGLCKHKGKKKNLLSIWHNMKLGKAYEGYDGLNKNGSHGLIYLNV